MSEVIALRGMVDGMDLDEEVDGAGDGGLMQEIGEECAEKVCLPAFLRCYHLANEWISTEELRGCILIDMGRLLQRFLSNSRASYLL